MEDTVGAFVSTFEVAGAGSGALAGLTLAVKDLYDVAGHVTGCGSPAWAATHPPATAHAPVVAMLLGAGARIVGKTHMDELAWSLTGANAHLGTPVNSAAPERLPGGSSSGSAAAVAAGLADIGLGSDTGGSVRLPAAFCGLCGVRTTHGAVPLGGAMPLAPSFDTVGWMARDRAVLDRVAEVCGLPAPGPGRVRLLMPVDLWAAAGAATVAALGPAFDRLQAAHGRAMPVLLAPEGLGVWLETFRVAQAAEIWETHGDWVEETRPAFGPGVAGRFAMAAEIAPEEHARADTRRARIRDRLVGLLGGGATLVLPTGPGPAPLRTADEAALDAFRARALRLLSPAGLGGLPQVTVPAGRVEGAPVGISLVGAPGTDRRLIAGIAPALD